MAGRRYQLLVHVAAYVGMKGNHLLKRHGLIPHSWGTNGGNLSEASEKVAKVPPPRQPSDTDLLVPNGAPATPFPDTYEKSLVFNLLLGPSSS
jgi:hypothetical protein